ncbi:PREDICTED: 60S ribosomal protein L13-1-like [Nicotiana attenuata]|uniref:60S ribosomal protein L13-1-like n=1 Tax=Nicotiana attenuata TaxID=49451 RepID=UPI000905D714|nr:PREDICTED: 60S ribosomal protein L13-1-like [Nicotiana attenuata]
MVNDNCPPMEIRNDMGVRVYMETKKENKNLGSYPLCISVRDFNMELAITNDNTSAVVVSVKVFGLKTYKAKLVVFPRRARKVKASDSAPEELATATQAHGAYMPIAREKPSVDFVKVTEEMKSFNA